MTMYIIGLILLRLLLTGIFFLGLYKIISHARGKMESKRANRESRGEIILKERFASGEIDEEKFKKMMAVLKG